MSTQYIRLPLGGSVPSYANLAAFPSASTTGNGALAIALDTDILYISTGSVWEAIGGGSVPLSIGMIDSQTPSSNGAVLASNTLVMQSASSSNPGLVKSGNLTDVGTDGIVVTNGSGSVIGTGTSIAQHVADATHNGYLSSTDWSIFNLKQPSGNYITGLTGDGAASGPGAVSLTLATVNSDVGSFGDASHTVSLTVNGKGLLTAVSSNSILIAESQVVNLVSDLAGKQPTGNYITTLTGDVSAFGPGSAASTLATVNSNVGSFGSSSAVPSFTVNGKGLITAASSSQLSLTTGVSGALPIANGGTGQVTKSAAFDALSPMTTGGDIIYGGASGTGTRLANGSAGQVLTSNGTTIAPSWQPVTATAPNSEVRLNTDALGTLPTFAFHWANTEVNTGSDITYASDAVNGDTFTINSSGIYSVNWCWLDTLVSANRDFCGITVNANPATVISSVPVANVLIFGSAYFSGNNGFASLSWTGHLTAADVVRCQNDGEAPSGNGFGKVSICRIA